MRPVLLLLLPTLLICAGKASAKEQRRDAFVFADTQDDVWAEDELEALTGLLGRLPKSLRELAASPGFGHIKVFKTNGVKTAPRHSAPPLLFWQLSVSTDGMTRSPRAEYLTELQREFAHQLLHVHDSVHDLSESKEWRRQSGWRPREYLGVKIPGLPREADNQDPRGYATAQGLNDAEEDFATFGSVYFVTPDSKVEDSIACRTPGKFAFFRKAFPDYKPYLDQPHIQCRPVDDGFLDDIQFLDPLTRQSIPMGRVNAETVTGFELLYATPGVADAAEVAGHLILRMKLKNNPMAETLGVENPNDLVLSFLADTDAGRPPPPQQKPDPEQCNRPLIDLGQGADVKDFDALRSVVQSLKGLAGGFLTTFDRQTLYQAVKNYTIDQDRNLLRYELVLTDAQKTRLIDQLYLAKKSYRTKYYFFDRNCASILVQLIGEGIGDDEVAEFDPLVVPPNALVALLIRKGLAREVHPAFYSYKKKGQFAQEEIKQRVAALAGRHPGLAWPNTQAFSRRTESTRTDAYEKLERIAQRRAELRAEIYQLGTLGQEAEMAFMDHTQRCEQFSTKPTLVIRRMQKSLLASNRALSEQASLDTNALIENKYGPKEMLAEGVGSSHTNLSSIRVGAGSLTRPGGKSHGVGTIGFALHRQDFGATSRQSMQRATFVALGEAEATSGLEAWRVTGLSIRKFKERLDQVPPFFTDSGTFGLGLTVLDLKGGRDVPTSGTVAGGELMANLWSSRLYERFVYASLGSAIEMEEGGKVHLALPVRVEGLWTLDERRDWQLRGIHEVRLRPEAGSMAKARISDVSVAYRLTEPAGTEVLLRASATAEDEQRLFQLGLEWNRW